MVPAERLRPPPNRQVQTVRVRVKGGYRPSVLHGRVGEPLRIIFSREETASCSEHVVFPAFGKSAMLPPFEDVALELMPERAGEYEFTCQLGMLRGRLIVEDNVTRSRAQASALSRTVRQRRTKSHDHDDTLLLAFVAWLCSLPLLLLVAVPFLGWRAGGMMALLWLGVVATACFVVCVRGDRRTKSAPVRDSKPGLHAAPPPG